MANVNQTDPISSSKASLLDSVTKFAAVLGTLVALGQAASTWIDGMYKAAAERERTEREVKLADIKERSALAESYLQLILSKDTPNDGRAILYSALGELEGHPLQKWARQRYALYIQYNTELSEAYSLRSEAAQHANEADGVIKNLEAEIETLNVQIQLNMDNPEKADELQQLRVAKSAELGKARAARSVATATVEVAAATIERTAGSDPTMVGVQPNLTTAISSLSGINSLSGSVDATLLKAIFPKEAWKTIDDNVQYLQAALQEFKIADPRMVSAIVATIATEAPNYQSGEESAATAARYEGRSDFGNTQTGDGAKFRGRGYIMLTGRTNYTEMSRLLGLGTRLVDAPNDAKSPEVAARIVVAWFADRQERLLASLGAGDLAAVRKQLSGGLNGFETFRTVYREMMEKLVGLKDPDRYKLYLHLGQFSGRSVPARATIDSALASVGFVVAGSDQQLDRFGPGVDYFHDDDAEGAKKVADSLNALLGPDQPPIKPRLQKVDNPEGLLGIWF